LRFLHKKLKNKLDKKLDITVRRSKINGNIDGYCSFYHDNGQNKHFKIRIDASMPEQMAIETLLHELAHAVCWESDENETDHGPSWGVAYARVYRWYLEWVEK
jgi:Zn-dependent peptidase ImmA (M78 family)